MTQKQAAIDKYKVKCCRYTAEILNTYLVKGMIGEKINNCETNHVICGSRIQQCTVLLSKISTK